MAKNYFNRYVWLIDLIYRHGHITMQQINSCWSRSALNDTRESKIPERTFFHHKTAIEDIFGICIKCDRSLGYYIENSESLTDGRLKEWMLQSLSLNNLVSESSAIRDRIIMEEVPSSQKWLAEIINAIRDNLILKMTYCSFNRKEPKTFTIAPYCLKMFRQRWYLMGKSEAYDSPRIYALDRIVEVRATEDTFSLPEGFDAAEHFSNFYGVSVYNDIAVEQIVIKAHAYQANYLRTLPLHHSQKETYHCEEHSIFTLSLVPTFEFEREMLSLGASVEVLSPQWLRQKIADEITEMAGKYTNR